MRIFLSWSGPRSAALARALRQWLPNVIQAVEPWMSDVDIDRGAPWSSELTAELAETQVGIICLTADNLSSPWLHFEAGALSKALDKSRVCTYLLDLKPTDIGWPLAMFQATRAEREETKQLVMTINKALGEAAGLSPERLNDTFERWWPDLEAEIKKALPSDNTAKSHRPDRELLEEVLTLLRSQTPGSVPRVYGLPSPGYYPESAVIFNTADLRLYCQKNYSWLALTPPVGSEFSESGAITTATGIGRD